jgi:hypothetical protein
MMSRPPVNAEITALPRAAAVSQVAGGGSPKGGTMSDGDLCYLSVHDLAGRIRRREVAGPVPPPISVVTPE